MNYYTRFPGDYLRDTRRLNLLEHGAYTLLLDELYSTEQRIPSVEDAMRICQAMTEEEQSDKAKQGGEVKAMGDEAKQLEQKQIGFWACFYCANTHQFGEQECSCSCHENESEERAKQNEEWNAWRRGERP